MQTEKRRFKLPVIHQLGEAPQRFEFFQAVRLLELWLKQSGVSSENILTDYIRFRNSLSLRFPPSQIETMQFSRKKNESTAQAESSTSIDAKDMERITLTPAFMGFLGASGTLPNHYTEEIVAHLMYKRDDAPRAFLDVFSNRVVGQFYKSWLKYRLALGYERDGQDRFLPLLLSLTGLGHVDLQEHQREGDQGVLDANIAHFATAVRRKPVSATVMQRTLAAYFAVPVKVLLFTGSWYKVPCTQQSRLGLNNAVLGVTAMSGERVWQRDLRIRIELGALDKVQFQNFLPEGKSAKALNSLLMLLTHHEFEYEIQLILAACHVQGNQLGSDPENGRLGWDTFLIDQSETQDRSDICYTLNGIH